MERNIIPVAVADVNEEDQQADVLQHEEDDAVAPEEAGHVEDGVQAEVGGQSHQLQAEVDQEKDA